MNSATALSLTEILQEELSLYERRMLGRAKEYYQQNRVGEIETKLLEDLTIYHSKVQGGERQPYRVEIKIQDDDVYDSSCTCPVGYYCKHVAALIIKLLGDNENQLMKNTSGVARIVSQKKDGQDSIQSLLKKISEQAKPERSNFSPTLQPKNTGDHALAYVIKNQRHSTGYVQNEITASLVRKLKAGGFGKSQTFHPFREAGMRCMLADDFPIVSFFKLTEYQSAGFETEYGETILEKIVASGRCYYQKISDKPLQLGETKPLECSWVCDEKGYQQLQFQVDHQPVELFFSQHPWYIQLKTQKMGRLQTTLNASLLKPFYCMPAVNITEANQIAKIIDTNFKEQLPKPLIKARKIITKNPIFCLYLSKEIFKRNSLHMRDQESIEHALGKLYFKYDSFNVSWDEPEEIIHRNKDGEFFAIHRNKPAEKSAVNILTKHKISTLNIYSSLTTHSSTKKFLNHFLITQPLEFSQKILPLLREQDFQIEFSDNYPFNIVADTEINWYSQVDDRTDWFDLELGVIINGEKLNLLPILQNIITQFLDRPEQLKKLCDDPQAVTHVRLADNRCLPIPYSRIKHIADILLELQEDDLTEKQQLKLGKMQLMRLLELEKGFEASAFRWIGGERLRELAKNLHDFQGIKKINLPATFSGHLRDYQQQGLNWLQFLREYELSGILADEMGLGKTVQMLAHISVEKAQGRLTKPCLVIATTSLMYNWHREAQQFTPQLKVLVLQGAQRKESFSLIQNQDIILTTYPLLSHDKEILLTHDYHLLVLDEAQFVKNSKSQAFAIVQQIKAKHRLCMTGTPLENHLGELWSLFHFLMPGFLGSEQNFKRMYRTPIEKLQDTARFAQLRMRILPFLLRRTKSMVATELPPKTEIMHHVELTDTQRDLYETVRIQMQQRVVQAVEKNGLNRSQIAILDALLKLRQICCDPALLKIESAKKAKYPSAKLDSLLELVNKLVEDNRRILLFSQFTEMLAIIETALIKQQIPYVKLTGSTKDRQTPIQTFQAGEVPLFLISLKAGGVGLNLTAADTVIHYDPWWNPAVEQQATDRTHRLGQTKNVFVYKFIAVGTVEEKIIALQQRKKVLLDGIFSEKNQKSAGLTLEDLKYLFS